MISPDSDLIARVVLWDDRDAFGELVLRHQSAVRRFLRHLTGGDHATADDLTQETFLQAYRSLSRHHGDSSFSTWLLGIAHNLHRNARRKAALFVPPPEEPLADETAPSSARSSDLRHDLAAALQSLSADEQTVIHLFYQQGLSHPEISEVVGWPLGTVKTHLARGKDKLRRLLAAWNPLT